MRITCSGRRHKYLGEVIALQSLDCGRPIIDTRWKEEIPNYSEVLCYTEFGEEDEVELEDI